MTKKQPPDGHHIHGGPLAEAETQPFDFAGWGEARRIADLGPVPPTAPHISHQHQLGQWKATALCGNDITSSVLYVSALCAAQAGALAPVVLLMVSGVLYLFRQVYAEVGSALPLNGGSYTVLLNTTSKRVAAIAACLTLLSYIATAVISAGEAAHYAKNLVAALPVGMATLGLLTLFALLTLWGIGESASVALVIFVLHLTVLSVLVVAGTITVVRSPGLLLANFHLPTATGVGHALFFGLAAAMLGISGFESSANFIEEQKPGVFPQTLRNMWRAVTIFNPWVSLLSLGLLPLAAIQAVPADLLAQMGARSAGQWLAWVVSLDAVLVLSGAVLTSYVGVTGLARRMSLDQVLPQVLLSENRLRGTNHWIILSFLALCASILWITGGRVELLAGVYTISFLSVMALFAIGNLLLKQERGELPRSTEASVATVLVALVAVLVALLGNIVLEPVNLQIFLLYFGIATGAVMLMFLRVAILRMLLSSSQNFVAHLFRMNSRLRKSVEAKLRDIGDRGVIYFTKGDAIDVLNRAALYVLRNEQTSRLTVVHAYGDGAQVPPELADQLRLIDRLYPTLRIDFLAVQGVFGPDLIAQLSERLRVPRNAMFIGTPSDRFPHRIETLGGVRVIL
ncbi:MAG: APC family permease [Gemmatimonadota bacterium]